MANCKPNIFPIDNPPSYNIPTAKAVGYTYLSIIFYSKPLLEEKFLIFTIYVYEYVAYPMALAMGIRTFLSHVKKLYNSVPFLIPIFRKISSFS